MPIVTVEAYAGGSYPTHPRAVIWQGHRYDVEEVERAWRTPEGLVFEVRCQDGPRLTLTYNEINDQWQAEASSTGDC